MKRRELLISSLMISVPFSGCTYLQSEKETTALRLHSANDIELPSPTLESELRTDQHRILEIIIESDTEQAIAFGYDPFFSEQYVQFNHEYYEIVTRDAGMEQTIKPVLYARQSQSKESVLLDEYSGRPANLIKDAIEKSGKGPGGGVVLHPNISGVDELLPTPKNKYINYNENVYKLTVEDRTLLLERYIVTAERVAMTSEEFHSYLIDRRVSVVIGEQNTTKQQQNILDRATMEFYSETIQKGESYSEPFRDLIKLLQTGEVVDGRPPDTYLISWRTNPYWARILRGRSEL